MNIEKRDILYRHRRLRKTDNMRRLVQENHLHLDDLIAPVFVIEGKNIQNPIPSMPGIFQWSLDKISGEIDNLLDSGISRIILFGIPENKDNEGSGSYMESGIIQKTVRKLNTEYPELFIITDLCFCGYTDHGHCGIVDDNDVQNDATLAFLGKQAISHAQAGSHMVAPSSMIDGMVGEIRSALDGADYETIPIMSYAVKYASSFYGPFRDAVDSSPKFGNRKSYQMDPGNIREAVKEVESDIIEGADIIMVKPALSYLDVIHEIKQIVNIPVACYNVSGEYSMLKAAAEKGWLDHNAVMMEMLLSMKRAGADIILTYFAKEAAELIKQTNGVR